MIKRKSFQKLLADLRELHDLDYVIIRTVARWARDNEDYWVARGLVNRAGATLHSAKEPIGKTPTTASSSRECWPLWLL